ncbi:MAG TPA: S8 family serine peptidase [Chloroflexota bacterium]|nr:S8 family serine peptidase [Chloroflexota bacterium]
MSLALATGLANGGAGPAPPSAALAAPPGPGARSDVDAPAVSGQFLLRFRPGTPAEARRATVRTHGGSVFARVAALDVEAAEFPALKGSADRRSAEALVNALKRNPNVVSVEPNLIYTATFTPNDPGLSQQWAWNTIQAFGAWDTTQGSTGTAVAIVDTGIQRDHPDLSAKILPGQDFVDGDTAPDDGHGHGTHVAGTVAAETNNATGGAGLCPDCRLLPVRVLNNSGSGTLVNVANGITWAADNGAKVINLSLGGGGSSTLENAVNYAWNKGVFLACAAGNSNTSTPSYPAGYANCFAVASTTSTDARSSFSNYGGWVEVAAPGSSIYSTWIGSGYNTISGTSMATPHVAGLAGLLASQGLTNAQIWQRICDSADRIAGTGTSWSCGRINADRAVKGVVEPPAPPPPPPPSSDVIVNGGFEDGTSPWTQLSTNGFPLITPDRPRTGSHSAWLGGYNSAYDRVYQPVTIPADGTLTYFWYMTSSEGSFVSYDYLRVRLFNPNGQLVATLRTRSNTSPRNGWYQDSISLASYAGQTLNVHFSVSTDFSLPTSFFIDDVSLK